MKGVSAIIATVLIILFSVAAISIVLMVGTPAINRARDSGIVNEAYQNMRVVDNLIRTVSSEGPGSLRTAQIKSVGGTYRISPVAGTFDYELELSSDLFPRGTFKKEGNLQTIVGGGAKASQNSTHLILENEILEIVFYRNGSESNFDSINTSTLIRTITIKDSSFVIKPNDTGIMIENYTNTSWGIGYSKLVSESTQLAKAEVLAHVRSNFTGVEYEVLYTLPASADFLIMTVRNTTGNLTTVTLRYELGTNTSDILKLPNNETTFAPNGIVYSGKTSPPSSCYTSADTSDFYLCSYDNIEYTANPKAVALIYSGPDDKLIKFCNNEYNNTREYYFNMSASGQLRTVIPVTNGICTDIGNKTYIVRNQEIPSTSFGSYVLKGSNLFHLSLVYDKIKIAGEGRFTTGTHRVCIKKIGQEAGRAIVNVTAC